MRRLTRARGARRGARGVRLGLAADSGEGHLDPRRQGPVPGHDPARRQAGRHAGRGRAAPLPARLDRRAAQADEGHLVAGRRRRRPGLRGRDRRAGPHGDRHASRARRPATALAAAPPRDGRAAGLRRVRDRRRTSTSSAAASAATASTCAARSSRSRSPSRARTPPSRSSRARPAGACGSPTAQVAAFAFPGSPGGTGCQLGDEPACGFPPLEDRAEVCVTGARLDEDLYTGTFAQTLERLRGAGRAAARAAAVGARADQVARRQRRARPRCSRTSRASRRRGSRSAGCSSTTRGRRATARSSFDRDALPRPGRADPPGARARRALHALGLAEGRPAAPAIRRAPSSAPIESRTLDLRRPRRRAPSTRRGCASSSRSASTASRATAATRSTSSAIEPDAPERLPAALRATPSLGVLPPDAGAIFRAGDDGLAERPAGSLGRRPVRRLDRPPARDPRRRRRAAMSGFPTWGSDVGGYSAGDLTAEVFARWAQLGAVSPVMEVGGAGPNATPWVLGPTAMRVLRDVGRPPLRALPVLLRPAPARRARAAAARLRLSGRPGVLARRPRAARRPRPARGAGHRRRARRRASTCRRARGSTSTPARR